MVCKISPLSGFDPRTSQARSGAIPTEFSRPTKVGTRRHLICLLFGVSTVCAGLGVGVRMGVGRQTGEWRRLRNEELRICTVTLHCPVWNPKVC